MPRIQYMIRDQVTAQNQMLAYLLKTAQQTAWGQAHHFHRIRTYREFKESVSIQSYDSLKPWFDQIKIGQQDVLWPGRVRWFSKSSGTTSDKSKFIPLTKDSIRACHIKGGKDLMAMYYDRFPQSRVFGGKTLISGGSISDNLGHGVRAGDVSAVLIHQIPEWLQFFRVPSRQIATLPNWEQKIEIMAQKVWREDVTTLSGVPTWIMMLMERVLHVTGRKTIAEVWPNLELLVHGGVDFSPYRDAFLQLAGKPVNFINTYNASEGFFAFQDCNEEGMLLHTDVGVFYEFVSAEDSENPGAEAVSLRDVQVGKNYALIISTNAGLWRYRIGDTLRFTSLSPYRVALTGRTAQFLNAFGEEVMVHNTDKAIAAAAAQMNCSVKDYTVTTVFGANRFSGHHLWIVEFERAPENTSRFAQQLDGELQQLNSDYEAKRKDNLILQPPVVEAVREGTFYAWLKANRRTGAQYKVPRLSPDSGIIDALRLTQLGH